MRGLKNFWERKVKMSEEKSEPIRVEVKEGDQAKAEALTPEQIQELKAKAAKADEHWERLLRQAADLENYKKRAARDREDGIKRANSDLLAKLIPVMDNFEMALAAVNNADAKAVDSLKTGILMIHGQLKAAVADAGLEEVDATGKAFDPNLHEAISQQESKDVPEGQVIQQLRRGYKYKDRLLRPASVIVAKKPAA